MKDGVEIANSQSIRKPDSRYDIDRATYALIIDPVDENDTSSSYECQVFVTNPITNTKQRLQYFPQLAGMQLSLTTNEKKRKREIGVNFKLTMQIKLPQN